MIGWTEKSGWFLRRWNNFIFLTWLYFFNCSLGLYWARIWPSQPCTHRHNEERAQGVPKATPISNKMGPIRSKIGGKGPKWGLFWVLSYMKIPLVSPCLDQKEKNETTSTLINHPLLILLNNTNGLKKSKMDHRHWGDASILI